jgi:hypothetical protein
VAAQGDERREGGRPRTGGAAPSCPLTWGCHRQLPGDGSRLTHLAACAGLDILLLRFPGRHADEVPLSGP